MFCVREHIAVVVILLVFDRYNNLNEALSYYILSDCISYEHAPDRCRFVKRRAAGSKMSD